MKLQITCKKGMSVLEILIAMTLLLAAVIPIIFTFRYSSVANVKSVKALQAANLAIEKMEEFKFSGRTPIYDLTNFSNSGATPDEIFKKYNEYTRLKMFLDMERNKKSSATFAPYTVTEDYGEIGGLPDFKRTTTIAFFPKADFEMKEKFSPFTPSVSGISDTLSIPEQMAMYEAKRMVKRISIEVKVSYFDKTRKLEENKEQFFTAFTLVTNKEF